MKQSHTPPQTTAPRLVLASRSPRRAALLRQAGLTFTQADPPFADPPQPEHGDAPALALALARRKAESAAALPAVRGAQGPVVILAADTIVVGPEGSLLGQPADAGDARRMLRAIIGRTHQVVTGVALLRANGAAGRDQVEWMECFTDLAVVHVGAVSEAEVQGYLAGGDWRGKAGAYNLAELEARWPFRVDGDAATVVGLPMRRLLPALSRAGVKARASADGADPAGD